MIKKWNKIIFPFVILAIVFEGVGANGDFHLSGSNVIITQRLPGRSFTRIVSAQLNMTGCAMVPPVKPTRTIAVTGNHNLCVRECGKDWRCVGYNFHWDSTKCEVFNSVPPVFIYDRNCKFYLVLNYSEQY